MNDETLLTTELARRADRVVAPPLAFEDVRDRAHGIRRRRRAVAAAAVAAAVALAIVLPTVLTGGSNRSDGIDPAPEPPVRGAVVLHDGQLTMPDGTTAPIDLANEHVGTFGVLTDGRVVVARDDRAAIQVFSPDGQLDAEYPVETTSLSMSPDDRAAAWMSRGGGVRVLESDSARPVELGTVEVDPLTGAMVDAVLDAGHVLIGDGNTTTTEVSADGVRPIATSEPLRVTDISPDGTTWAVKYADDSDPQFGCSGLYDPAADRIIARNCDTALLAFSPDGEHLTGALGDGGTWSSVEIFDHSLHLVRTYDPGHEQVISGWAWGDGGHVLAVVAGLQDHQWSLIRFGVDGGDPEVVAGPYHGRNPEGFKEFIPSD